MTVTCQKTLMLCTNPTLILTGVKVVWVSQYTLVCGGGTLWFYEYHVDKVWRTTFNHKVILQKSSRTTSNTVKSSKRPHLERETEYFISFLAHLTVYWYLYLMHWRLSHTVSFRVFLFFKWWLFPQEQNSEFLFPRSTVIPWVCLRLECALGSFQHLWDWAGRRRHSDFCSRMPCSHPLGLCLKNKDCTVC